MSCEAEGIAPTTTLAGDTQNLVNPSSVAATVPQTRDISPTLGQGITAGLISTITTAIAASPAARAARNGATVYTGENGAPALAVGTIGATPAQLVLAGILKPGSDRLIARMLQAGETDPEKLLPPTLFTGILGATSLQSIAHNSSVQAEIARRVLKQSESALVQSGLLDDTTPAGDRSGLVLSGAEAGITSTLSTVRSLTNESVNVQSGLLVTPAGGTMTSISPLADSALLLSGPVDVVTGPLAQDHPALSSSYDLLIAGSSSQTSTLLSGPGGGLVAALGNSELLRTSTSLSDAAFKTIAGSLPTLKSNTPVYTGVVTTASVASAQDLVGRTYNFETNGLSYSSTGNIGTVQSLQNVFETTASGAASSLANPYQSTYSDTLATESADLINTLPEISSGLSGGMGYLPGGVATVASIVGSGDTLSTLVQTGLGPITGAVNGAISTVSGLAAPFTDLTAGINGAAGAAISSLTSTVNNNIAGLTSMLSKGTAGIESLVTSNLPAAARAQIMAVAGVGARLGVPIMKSGGSQISAIIDQKLSSLISGKPIPADQLISLIPKALPVSAAVSAAASAAAPTQTQPYSPAMVGSTFITPSAVNTTVWPQWYPTPESVTGG